MRIIEVKCNEQTGDVSIRFSGGRPTLLAKALDVTHDNQGKITSIVLDRLVPNWQDIESEQWVTSGCYTSVICRR